MRCSALRKAEDSKRCCLPAQVSLNLDETVQSDTAACDLAKLRRRRSRVNAAKERMVHHVKRVQTRLERQALAKPDLAHHAEVGLVDTRTAQPVDVDWKFAGLKGSRLASRSLVPTLSARLSARNDDIAGARVRRDAACGVEIVV